MTGIAAPKLWFASDMWVSKCLFRSIKIYYWFQLLCDYIVFTSLLKKPYMNFKICRYTYTFQKVSLGLNFRLNVTSYNYSKPYHWYKKCNKWIYLYQVIFNIKTCINKSILKIGVKECFDLALFHREKLLVLAWIGCVQMFLFTLG